MKTYEQLQEDIDDDKNPSIDEVWNVAIEAAAIRAEAKESGKWIANQIRELKK